MKKQMRAVIVSVAMLIIGTIGGFIAGSRTANVQWKDSVQTLCLAQAGKETAVYTRLLEGLREGKQELVADRLEILLDHAVIDIGFHYAPEYDLGGWAGKSLALARDYRTTHPHTPSSNWTADRVNAAFSLKTRDKQDDLN